MIYCLHYNSFTPGTVIRDQPAGIDHTVVKVRSSLILDPPSAYRSLFFHHRRHLPPLESEK